MDCEFVRKTSGRPTNRPSMEVLADLHREHSADEIAKMYGVSVSTVRGWIWNYKKQLEIRAEIERATMDAIQGKRVFLGET